MTGGTAGFRVIWNSPWKQPMPSKQSEGVLRGDGEAVIEGN